MQRLFKKLGFFLLGMMILSGCGTQEGVQSLKTGIILDTSVSTEAVKAIETETAAKTEASLENGVALDEGIEIQKSSKQISGRLANEVFEDIKGQISASNEGISRCENFKLVISGEKKKEDGLIWEKLWIYYDLVPDREPGEDPFVIGMKDARDELTDREQIACADEEIDGWMKELDGNYQQQKEEPDMWQQMWLAYDPGGEDYTIYCDTQPDGQYKQVTLEEYIKQHTEDYELRKAEGRDYILLRLLNYSNNI